MSNIYKRATQQLRSVGIDNIVIRKGLWGPWPEDITINRQSSRCFESPAQAVAAVMAGYRPINEEGVGGPLYGLEAEDLPFSEPPLAED